MNTALLKSYWPLAGVLLLAIAFVGVTALRRADSASSSRRLALALVEATISTIAILLLVFYLLSARSYVAAIAVTILWFLIISASLIGMMAAYRRREEWMRSD